MVEIKEKDKQIETVEKRGKVLSAEEKRMIDEKHDTKHKFRDYGEVDFEDHEIEETEKRAKKEMKEIEDINNPFYRGKK